MKKIIITVFIGFLINNSLVAQETPKNVDQLNSDKPTDDVQHENDLTTENPVKNPPLEEELIIEAALIEAKFEQIPLEEIPVMQASLEEVPVKQELTKEQPVNEASIKDTTVKDTPVKDAPVKNAPVKNAPVKNAPAKEAPNKKEPVKEAPTKEQPVNETSIKDATVKDTPVKDAPVKNAPVKDAPNKKEPVKESPSKEQPVKNAPAKEAPAKEAPAKEALAKEAPAKQAPVKNAPVKNASPSNEPTKVPVKQNITQPIPQAPSQTGNNKPTQKQVEQTNLLEDWEKHMVNFIPDDMLSFVLLGSTLEIAIENVTSPTTLRGAFFSNDPNEYIDFLIKAPSGKTIFLKDKSGEGIFAINTTEIGFHEFLFDNRKGKKQKLITFALDIENSLKDTIEQTDIDPLAVEVQDIQKSLYDLYYEYKFAQLRFDSSHDSMKGTNQRIMVFTIVETLAVLGVTIWQIWYIKKLFKSQRLI